MGSPGVDCCGTHASALVLIEGDWFQVCGVDAHPLAAQVVEAHTNRNGSNFLLVHVAVCPNGRCSPHHIDLAVPVGERPLPYPTSVLVLDPVGARTSLPVPLHESLVIALMDIEIRMVAGISAGSLPTTAATKAVLFVLCHDMERTYL